MTRWQDELLESWHLHFPLLLLLFLLLLSCCSIARPPPFWKISGIPTRIPKNPQRESRSERIRCFRVAEDVLLRCNSIDPSSPTSDIYLILLVVSLLIVVMADRLILHKISLNSFSQKNFGWNLATMSVKKSIDSKYWLTRLTEMLIGVAFLTFYDTEMSSAANFTWFHSIYFIPNPI